MAGLIRRAAAAAFVAWATMAVPGHAQAPEPAQPQEPAPPSDAQPQADQQPPVFRADINFVRVDAIVTDRDGRPVADLQPGDFEILESEKPQAIETFRYYELNGGMLDPSPPRPIRSDDDEQREAAREDVRLFAMFLDDYHVRRESSLVSRRDLSRFVETQLGPTDMIALMYPLEPIAALRFTRNHGAVRRGIEQFTGRKFEYEPKNSLEERYAYYPTETVERIRNQVSLSALESLIVHMGGLKEGRKALVLVSEGYTNMLPPQMRNPVAAMPGFDNPARNNPSAGADDINEFRAQAMASFDMQQELRQIYTMANRYNVAIYAVDPRGLAVSEFDIADNIDSRIGRDYLNSTMDTLRVLSLETDGRAVVNRNDLALGMRQIVVDSSSYYLIGYNSTEAPTDGKFHEIKVRVNRPGLRVRARRGYWALTREDVARVTAPAKPGPPKAVEAAIASIGSPTRARRVRTWMGSARGDDGKTRVTFVWEPVGPVPGETRPPGDEPDGVSLTAVAEDGAPLFRGRIARPTQPGPAQATFDVPPGRVQVRMAVEAAGGDVLDSEVREVQVPDMMAAGVASGTPFMFRARTVRDAQLIKANPTAAPTPAREFSRADRLVVKLEVYGPADAAPHITARLLNRTGQAMSEIPVAMEAASRQAVIELALAALAPGEYVIEIGPAGPTGGTELLGFRVTS